MPELKKSIVQLDTLRKSELRAIVSRCFCSASEDSDNLMHFDLKVVFEPLKGCFVLCLAVDTTVNLNIESRAYSSSHQPCCSMAL
ncbi:uncharacterized [Tachysurus ichikawai]